jgi:CRISPR-associated protein Csy1
MNLWRSGRPTDALAMFDRLLLAQPNDPLALHGKSTILADQGDKQQGVIFASAAVAAAPHHAGLHYALANLLVDTQNLSDARRAFSAALRLHPQFFEAWNNLGLLLQDMGALHEAEQAFRQALRVREGHPGALNNLATVLLALDRPEDAERYAEQAVVAAPRPVIYRVNLARLYRMSGRWQEALQVWEAGLRLQPEDRRLQEGKIEALLDLRRYADARALLEGRELTEFGHLWRRLARALAMANQTAAALSIYRALCVASPDDWRSRLDAVLTLPVIPSSAEEVLQARRRYSEGLENLLAQALPEVMASNAQANLLAAVERDNFGLAYQGGHDRELQVQYGKLIARLLDAALPAWRLPMAPRATTGRPIKVGFASSFIRDCTVGHYFMSWMTQLNREDFQVDVFILGGREDALTTEIRDKVARCTRAEGTLTQVAQYIADTQLDVLIYPELGMNDRALALACLRLAPVQCVAWGHPVTSGFDSIDVYFSSAAMEVDDAAAHYSERLALLPALGTCYAPPARPEAVDRRSLGLPTEGKLLFFPHSLFKIQPTDDDVLIAVLCANPGVVAVLFEGESPETTQDYRQRLGVRMRDSGLGSERVCFLPLMPRSRFLQVCGVCTLMLDCLQWSGGNTTLDALAMGVPVVTQPGRLMRSRQTAGMLKIINITELVAESVEQLLALASRVLSDDLWRNELSHKIEQRRDRLFNDHAPIRALEAHLRTIVREGGSPQFSPWKFPGSNDECRAAYAPTICPHEAP